MPVMSGFGALAELPWERVTDKIERRILAGHQGMIVWWKMKAGAHAAAHQHPHEQIVWMLKGKMDFRIGNEKRSMLAGDVAVIPGNTEHEGIFPENQSKRLLHRLASPASLHRRRSCNRRSSACPRNSAHPSSALRQHLAADKHQFMAKVIREPRLVIRMSGPLLCRP